MKQMFIKAAEQGLVHDSLIRAGIRKLLKDRLAASVMPLDNFLGYVENAPIAVATDSANKQHYEVPTSYFQEVLGPQLKYSCGLYNEKNTTLKEAEEAMLALTCERARIEHGHTILELGCGWGSLTLWMAEHFPDNLILAVSNSASQKAFIEGQAKERGFPNITVMKADMATFQPVGRFDRIVSVEMFEHMRNHRKLMKQITSWLNPGGALFVHIFAHQEKAYLFNAGDGVDWMADYFFTGGMMPSLELLPTCKGKLSLEHQWTVNGTHYSRTLEDWLAKHDEKKETLIPLFEQVYGHDQALVWFNRWRIFYMACSELFKYNEGHEWVVAHYLFAK